MDTKQLMSEALSLSPAERAAMVGALVRSLEIESDPETATPWSEEIRSRLEDCRVEKAAPISWSEAYRRVHEAAERRRSWE